MASATGVRLTLKFNFAQEIRFAGWSESYDLGYADLPSAIAAKGQIAAFIADRCFTLGAGPLLVEAVLSAYVQPLTPGAQTVRRSTISIPIPPFPPPGEAYNKAFNPTVALTADFVTTSLYVSMQTNLSGTPVYRRNLWLAGLPDVADQTSSAKITHPDTLAAVKKFLADLENNNSSPGGQNNVSIRSIDRGPGNAVKPCTGWNLGLNSYTVPAHGFVPNQPILAEGMRVAKGGSAPRGRYLVGAVVDANTITLQGSSPPSAPIKTGGFRAAIITFNAVQLANMQGFTKRNHGRPSGLLVGRRAKPATVRS